MALVNYMSQILVELIKLANLIITISKSLACANRVNTVLEKKTSMIEKTGQVITQKEDTVRVVFPHLIFSLTVPLNKTAFCGITPILSLRSEKEYSFIFTPCS